MWTFVWCVTILFGGHDGKEATDRLIPPGWQGNPWGPEATLAREAGKIPPIKMSPYMKQWDTWGKAVLRDGDVLFRRADARVLFGRFPFSRFTANVSGSPFSHTAIVAIEKGQPVVYDTTKAGVRRQPFAVWMLDNVGAFGVKRVKPELRSSAEAAVRFCREVFEKQVPFDYDLGLDDKAYYCVEMTEKAYRAAGLPLSEPVRLGDMERVTEFPVCIFAFMQLSHLSLEQAVYFPGNERHGIWSCPHLQTVFFVPPKPAPARTTKPTATATNSSSREKPAVTDQKRAARTGATSS
jgi:hypothetical protein